MAVNWEATCLTASNGFDTPTLAILLTILFASYVLADSLLASAVIWRKAAEAELVTAKSLGIL